MKHGRYILFYKPQPIVWACNIGDDPEKTKEEYNRNEFGKLIASGTLGEMCKRLVGEVYARIGEKRKAEEQNKQSYTFEINDRTDPENYQIFDCNKGTWMKLQEIQPFFKQELLDRKKKTEEAERKASGQQYYRFTNSGDFYKFRPGSFSFIYKDEL